MPYDPFNDPGDLGFFDDQPDNINTETLESDPNPNFHSPAPGESENDYD